MNRIPRVTCTLEFKLETLWSVFGGDAVRHVARRIGIPEQSIRNRAKGQVIGKVSTTQQGRPIKQEKMKISRLRADVARLKIEA